jgi:hypothetical protein
MGASLVDICLNIQVRIAAVYIRTMHEASQGPKEGRKSAVLLMLRPSTEMLLTVPIHAGRLTKELTRFPAFNHKLRHCTTLAEGVHISALEDALRCKST